VVLHLQILDGKDLSFGHVWAMHFLPGGPVQVRPRALEAHTRGSLLFP
jgi:hypothetical protein